MKKTITFLRKISLFKRLTIGFLLLVIPPILIVNAFWYHTFSQEVSTLSEKLMTSIMTHAKNTVFKVFAEYEEASYNIYSDPEIIELLKSCTNYYLAGDFMAEKQDEYEDVKVKLGHRLHELTSNLSYISNVQIITSYDQFSTYSKQGSRVGGVIKRLPDFLNSPYYTSTLEANGYPLWFNTTKVYDIFYRNLDSSYGIADTLTLTRAIKNPYTDLHLGIIVMNINASFLHQVFLNASYSTEGNLILLGNEGPITSLSSQPNAPIPSTGLTLPDELCGSDSGSFYTFVESSYCLIDYVRVPHTDFYLANIMEHNILIRGAMQSISSLFFSSILWAIISGLLAYLITRSVSLPINRLKSTMSQVSLNQLDIEIPITSQDEIGVLEQKFNEMVSDLKDLIHKVYISELEQKELSFRKKNAELNALQMQINPHFLYNTLDIIRWEAMYQENGEGKVSQMIADFSNLLRLGTKKNMDFVPISEELAHVEAYMKVINYKFQDHILLELDFPFDTEKYVIPKLTLQPLVENAILHGFDGFDGFKKITISGVLKDSFITLSIHDTGRGMSDKVIQSIYTNLNQSSIAHKSIGLYNTNERMKLYFGSDYTFLINSSPETGTIIELNFKISTLNLLEGVHRDV